MGTQSSFLGGPKMPRFAWLWVGMMLLSCAAQPQATLAQKPGEKSPEKTDQADKSDKGEKAGEKKEEKKDEKKPS